MGSGNAGTGVQRWPLSARLLILSSLVTILGFSTVCSSVMLDMRRGEEVLARQTSENLATTIDADIGRTVELYDLSLRAVVSGMMMPELGQLSREMRHLLLFDHAASASHFGAIQVFNSHGDLTIDSAAIEPAAQNSADDTFFKIHRGDGERGLFISRPMLHRGAYAIVLSRRISDAEGNFAGVVAGAIRFSYFHELFGRLKLTPEETITVFRRDGVVIMRTPFDLDVIGTNARNTPVMKAVLGMSDGTYSGIGGVDKVNRLYVWRDNGRPLIVVVGKPWATIFSLWQKQAVRIGGIMLGLIVFISAVTLFLVSEIRRRARAEDRLEELATTDALTGLRNRRKFDTAIELEWRRAIRQSQPLAMLLIDADHFKIFNDTFGHQPGDQALMAIAGCITGAVNRAGDCAARYGGEEFAVLLPGASAEEALAVAEKIRLSVEQLATEPAPLTASIGVASLTPLVTMEYSKLVEAADKALYAAKAAGRNQSVVAAPSHRLMAA
ncbi:MAG: sensor domain-containing diguanylate cyclase [Tardiphaga sp.]